MMYVKSVRLTENQSLIRNSVSLPDQKILGHLILFYVSVDLLTETILLIPVVDRGLYSNLVGTNIR